MPDPSRLDALKAALDSVSEAVRFEIQRGELAYIRVADAAMEIALDAAAPGDPWVIRPSEFSDWEYADGRHAPLTEEERPLVLALVRRELEARGLAHETAVS